jgi:hypothetical protein
VRPKAGWYNQPIGCSAHGGETHQPYSKEEEEEEEEETLSTDNRAVLGT